MAQVTQDRVVRAPSEASARRPGRLGWEEPLAIALLVALVAAVYVWTNAPLYNPFGSIDPWLYTALWTNFHQTYHAFITTYYVSRVPWIAPGVAANAVFDARTAFFVVHILFFVAGAALMWWSCRRYIGAAGAALALVLLIGNQMYFDAHRWDYEEGGVLTFLIGAVACAAPRTRAPSRRFLMLGFCGFFSAAVFATRLVDVAYLVGVPIFYGLLSWDYESPARWKALLKDSAAFFVGAITLLIACGSFAVANGAGFFFFMPQIRTTLNASSGANQLPVHTWIRTEPYALVPLLAVGVALVVLAARPRVDFLARRFVIASAAWTGIALLGIGAWEFLGGGFVFELPYYFSSFVPPTAFCLAAALGVAAAPLRSRWRWAAVATATAGTLAPLAWEYRRDSFLRLAHGFGAESSYRYVLYAVVASVVTAVVWRLRPRPAPLLAFTAAVTTAAGLAYSTSLGTWYGAGSDDRTGDLYALGQSLVSYLHGQGYRDRLPHFWYDATAGVGEYGALQSLYYFAYTYVGLSMPKVDADFRPRLTSFADDRIVLLCGDRACGGARKSLRAAGLNPRRVSETLLRSGRVQVWVAIYRVRLPAQS